MRTRPGHKVVPFPALESRDPPSGPLRPKGGLSRRALIVLGIIAILPLLSVAIRVLSLPGLVGPGLGGLQAIGGTIDEALTLNAIPADQRAHVLYLLLLPTCALLVALARLTFGIRVLGFRSILLAVGFHASGIVPSLLLIAVAVGTVVSVRPWMRRIELPYYARVSVILCIVTTTMVAALVAGPWVRSDVVWGVAYFPVIVLGMLAEGIAHTLERDNIVTAIWRATTTILLAFLIALVCWIPVVRSTFLAYPELVLTQIVAIVLIAKYVDLRLLQDWDAKIAAVVLPRFFAAHGTRLAVAVVRNRLEPGQAAQAKRAPALRSVQKIVDALRKGGHKVKVLEGDMTLLGEIHRFFPLDPRSGRLQGIVLNLAHGLHGDARFTHVPALLEMADVAYTGPSPLGHAIACDRVLALAALAEAGLPTPKSWRVDGHQAKLPRVSFPAMVRARNDWMVRPRVVKDRREMKAAIRELARLGEEAIVEQSIIGRRFAVALIGNGSPECLPLVELGADRGKKVCPAILDASLAEHIREHAVRAFRACGCRDYARVDVHVDTTGNPCVMAVSTLGILAREGAFARAGLAAGESFEKLVCRIIAVASQRCQVADSNAESRTWPGKQSTTNPGNSKRQETVSTG